MRFSPVVANLVKHYSVAEALNSKISGKPLFVKGWVKKKAVRKKTSFIHVDDGSCLKRLQVVVPADIFPKEIGFNSCISVMGSLKESRGSQQSVEMAAETIEVISGPSPLDYPFVEKMTYLVEDVRSQPHFRPRVRDFASLLRLRAQVKSSIRKYFEEKGFCHVDTPILTSNNCEGSGEIFQVKGCGIIRQHNPLTKVGDGIFGHPVFLTVSGQLHLEAAASGLGKVYTFNPAFRGEKGTKSHLHEFWMVEAEEAFLYGREGFEALLDQMEEFIKFVVRDTVSSSSEELEYLWDFHEKGADYKELISKTVETPFVRITFKEAEKILQKEEHRLKTERHVGQSLNKESERFLCSYLGNVPVIVTEFPASIKPFYMTPVEDSNKVYCGDVLLPHIGEVCGGSLREHRWEDLQSKLEELEMTEQLKWYADIRRWGHPPTGGYGLGLERLLQFITGIDNIRDVIPFNRANGYCPC